MTPLRLHPPEMVSHPRHEPGSQRFDAPEQRRVALQSQPEIHGQDEIDQFALGVSVAQAVPDCRHVQQATERSTDRLRDTRGEVSGETGEIA